MPVITKELSRIPGGSIGGTFVGVTGIVGKGDGVFVGTISVGVGSVGVSVGVTSVMVGVGLGMGVEVGEGAGVFEGTKVGVVVGLRSSENT